MDTEEQYRHEWKYEITYCEYQALRMRLRPVMQPDPHAGRDGTYRICSLYFDNFRDKALMEKLNGVNIRDKYRIRYYNDNDAFIALERKSRKNSLCKKQTCLISRTACEKILAGDTDWMRCAADPLLRVFYADSTTQLLRPKTIVSYIREPFVYEPGNVRVTFDMDIRSGLFHTALFDRAHPLTPALPGKMILEVKYDQFLPDIIRMLLQSGTPRVGAFSKYAACRQYELFTGGKL